MRSGMIDRMHAGYRSRAAEGVGEPLEAGKQCVAIDAELSGETLSSWMDMRATGHHQAEVALCAHKQPI